MRTALLDVTLDVPVNDVSDVQRPDWWREVFESLRTKADEAAALAGGTLRTDRNPEITTRWGEHVLLGGDWLLIGSRWHCEVPESFDADRRS